MVPPALRLHDEEVEERHDGDISDYGRDERLDLGEPEIAAWGEDIDLDTTAIRAPSGEAADQDFVRCLAESGRLEEVSVIGSDNGLFDIFGVPAGKQLN